jgi:hypothetical protein
VFNISVICLQLGSPLDPRHRPISSLLLRHRPQPPRLYCLVDDQRSQSNHPLVLSQRPDMARPTSDASKPLLRDSARDSYGTVTSAAVNENPAEVACGTDVSRNDLIWILCGLYSAVFLGALDGESRGAASFMIPC